MIVREQSLTNIANKIRSKTGKSAQLQFPNEFISEINSLATAGKNVITGTWSANGEKLFSKNNLGFQPEGAVLLLLAYSGSDSTNKIACAVYPDINGGGGKHGASNDQNNLTSQGYGFIVSSANNWTISLSSNFSNSPPVFQGAYFYVIWG